jgi:hypothetical protein
LLDVVYKPAVGAPRLVRVARLEDLLPPPLDAFLLEDVPKLTVVYSARPEWRRLSVNCVFGDTIVHGPLAIVGRRGSRFESLPAADRALAFSVLSQSDANGSDGAEIVAAVRDEAAAEYASLVAEKKPQPDPPQPAPPRAVADEFKAGWTALAIHAKNLIDDMIGEDVPPAEILGHIYGALLYASEHQHAAKDED